MRVSVALLGAVTASAILATTGCQLSNNEASGPPCSSQTFDVQDRSAPLGPRGELVKAFNQAANEQVASATMAEMVGRAGWAPEWDRAIYLSAGMSDAELREVSEADLEMACFTGLPGRNADPDLRSPHMSLFLLNGKPVQAELWSGQNPSLDFGDQMFVTPDTIVRFDPIAGVMVAE